MNPFAPIAAKDSPLDRISPRRQSRVRAAVYLVLALHLFALTGFLIRDFAKAQFRIAATTTSTTTNALVSSGTTDAPAPDRSPTIPSNSQSPAPSPSRSMTAALPGATAVTRESGSPPARPGAAVRNYFVVKGDTYYKIARASGVSPSALAEANPGTEPTKLKIGQVLRIPIKDPAPSSLQPDLARASTGGQAASRD